MVVNLRGHSIYYCFDKPPLYKVLIYKNYLF